MHYIKDQLHKPAMITFTQEFRREHRVTESQCILKYKSDDRLTVPAVYIRILNKVVYVKC